MNPDDTPLNEWVVDQLTRTQDQLRDLVRRHEEIVNHLADVCRRNDRIQAAGNAFIEQVDLLLQAGEIGTDKDLEEAIERLDILHQQWTEANT